MQDHKILREVKRNATFIEVQDLQWKNYNFIALLPSYKKAT
jgi:hypothetical protein